jgi:hypothetical protein
MRVTSTPIRRLAGSTASIAALMALLGASVVEAADTYPPLIDTLGGGHGVGNGQFHEPFGVDVAADGTWWVADHGNDRLQHFSATGSYLGKVPTSGAGPVQFLGPSGIDVFTPVGGGGERIAVAEERNHRVMILTTAGLHLRTLSIVTGATPDFMSYRRRALRQRERGGPHSRHRSGDGGQHPRLRRRRRAR